MANLADRILTQLSRTSVPLDDDELAERLGVIRQSVNAECRLLSTRGEIERGPGPDGKIVNALRVGAVRQAPVTPIRSGAPNTHVVPSETTGITSGAAFERHARLVLFEAWGVTLDSVILTLRGGVTHSFDLVSPNRSIVGDAKWFKDLQPIPAAKLSVISEYVWLLSNVERAERCFLVFGHDRAVPERWLRRFRPLSDGVEFWFLDAHLTRLA